jgi:hypothetical protein
MIHVLLQVQFLPRQNPLLCGEQDSHTPKLRIVKTRKNNVGKRFRLAVKAPIGRSNA